MSARRCGIVARWLLGLTIGAGGLACTSSPDAPVETPDAGTAPPPGGPDSPDAAPANPADASTPRARCVALATAICSKAAVCTGATAADPACVQTAAGPEQLKCDRVTAVSANHDRCLADVAASTCPLMLPASCGGVHTVDAPPSATLPTQGPPARCVAVARALCAKQAMCKGTAETPTCVQVAAGPAQLNCEKVTAVSATHDQCLADIPSSACPLMLPPSCKGAHQLGASGPASSAPADSPVGKCHTVATALCTKQATCMGGTKATAGCVADAIGKLGCTRVTGVSAGYDRCLADIPAGMCPATAPASCQGVLMTGTVAAGPGASWKCDAYGSYEVCMGEWQESWLCSSKDINMFGLGPTEGDARLMALKLCNDELSKQIVINNVYWRARTESDCATLSCRPN